MGTEAMPGGRELDVARVEERLRGREAARMPLEGLVPSAVLVLLRDGEKGLEVLLTQRSHDVRHHQGQVSFPGGMAEPEDADEIATALRESSEEIGLDAARVRILGRLDDYTTITKYHITPIVASVASFEGLAGRTDEITDVFAFPVALIGDTKRVLRIRGEAFGRREEVLFIAFGDHLLWGATARMLLNLLEIAR